MTYSSTFPDSELLDRYLLGECSSEERSLVDGWAAARAENAIWLAEVRHAIGDPFEPVSLASEAEIRRRVWASIEHGELPVDAREGQVPEQHIAVTQLYPLEAKQQDLGFRHPERRESVVMRWRPAAFVAGIAVAMFVGVWGIGNQSVTPSNPEKVYTTVRGEQATIGLPDGSRVQLAAGSRLTVAPDFGGSTRDITLQGEAVFQVVQRSKQPFRVHTRNVTTQVLGTVFGVRSYTDDTTVQIAVQDGRVAVNSVVLSAGEVGSVDASGTLAPVQRHTDVASVFDWTRGTLTFRDTPLRSVAAHLSRWYNVDVVVSEPMIGQLPLTTIVRIADPIDSIIKVIALTTGTQVQRQGNTVTISRSGQRIGRQGSRTHTPSLDSRGLNHPALPPRE